MDNLFHLAEVVVCKRFSIINANPQDIMKKKSERKHQNKLSNSATLTPSSTPSSSDYIKSINVELSEKRVNQRKERSRLAAQIRRNREGQSLILIQNALPISSHVLGLGLFHLNPKSTNDNDVTPGTVGRSQKKIVNSASSIQSTMTVTTAVNAEISPRVSSAPTAINLEKTRVLRIAGHTLFLLNKLSSYLRLQAQICLSLNSLSLFSMLIDFKEMRIAYVTPALAEATGWPWIKLLGAPLHKLMKLTNNSQNSKEIAKKLSPRSNRTLATSYSSISTEIKSQSACFSYPANFTAVNNNNETFNIISDNEFTLPEFITLLKLNSNEQHLWNTSKNNKPNETTLSSSFKCDNTKVTNTMLIDPVDINKSENTCNVPEIHQIINSDSNSNYSIDATHKSIPIFSSSSLLSSKPISTRILSSNATTSTLNSTDENKNGFNCCNTNHHDRTTTKSSHQKVGINSAKTDTELVFYCWSSSIINTFTDCSTGVSQTLKSLGECDVNNDSIDYIDSVNDTDKCSINNELLNTLMTNSFSPDSLTFDFSWPYSSSPSEINSVCNSSDVLTDINSNVSTGLYLCLLQPIYNKISEFDDLKHHVASINNNTERNLSNITSEINNYDKVNGVKNANLLNPPFQSLKDPRKSDVNDKQDSLISFMLHRNVGVRQSDDLSIEVFTANTTEFDLSATVKTPSLEKNTGCMNSKSYCHTYLNYALTIKMVKGNYKDCFNVDDENGVVDIHYLEFIHPEDLQDVITIFNEKFTIKYDTMQQRIRESCVYAVGSNQKVLHTTFENLLMQPQLNVSFDRNDSNTYQSGVKTMTCNSRNQYSLNRRYPKQSKSKQLYASSSSIRPLRLKTLTSNKNTPSSVIVRNNTIKPIEFFPFQPLRYTKQRSIQGLNQIIPINNQTKPIKLLSFNNNRIKVPCSSYLNSSLYGTTNDDNSKRISSALNISAIRSSVYTPNVPPVPYFVKSALPVVSYASSLPKKLVLMSPTSSLASSKTPMLVNKIVSPSKNKTLNDEKQNKYFEYQTLHQNNISTYSCNSNIYSFYTQISDLSSRKTLAPGRNKSWKPTVKTVCKDYWKSGDSWSSVTDNSSPNSGYSNGSSTSICLSPNDQNFADVEMSVQMEATVSELLESMPLTNKLSFDNDGVIQKDFNSCLYDQDAFEYGDSDLMLLDSDFESEDFTGLQPDLIPDLQFLSSPV
ncbi:asparagine-rich antigen [Schistosoma japonicum]|nr:asparagine-rich antigen [Schistosoma japonicum]